MSENDKEKHREDNSYQKEKGNVLRRALSLLLIGSESKSAVESHK